MAAIVLAVLPVTAAPAQQFDRAEPGEARPGGTATSAFAEIDANAFSHPSGNLGAARRLDFEIGNRIFGRVWEPAPSASESTDGLGPLYNARSCRRCHIRDGRGHPPASREDDAISMILLLSVPSPDADQTTPEPTYGAQLQDFAIAGHTPEGRIAVTYSERHVQLSNGETVSLRAPAYAVADAGYGPLSPGTMTSPRVANQMIGLGLLEAIDAAEIEALADPTDGDDDGISGRAARVWDGERGAQTLGRFGWKAGQPSVRAQTVAALSRDIGLSTSILPTPSGDCTEHQSECLSAPTGNTQRLGAAEVSNEALAFVLFYARNLAVPPRRNADEPDILEGKRLFHESGCAACHRPRFETLEDYPQRELAGQTIWPYTDLLLHDMGEGLADSRPEGSASGREWRTPPLWGIGLTNTVNGHTLYLHDGRARSLLEAILWHGGEAVTARQNVIDMTGEERDRLIEFVSSL